MLETNELTQKLRTLLHPRAALIAYSGEKDNSYASDNNYFVEIRDIDDNGMMGEGRPVTVDFMNELVRGYSESHSTTPYGRIPPQYAVVRPAQGSERYIWYNYPTETDDVFQGIPSSRECKIQPAGSHLRGRWQFVEYICLQGQETDGKDGALCRTVLQRDRGQMSVWVPLK